MKLPIRITARYKLALLGSAAVLALAVIAVAFATTETRLIHIFPTAVNETGWMKGELALDQALSASALPSDFKRSNSAFVIFEEGGSDAISQDSSDVGAPSGQPDTEENATVQAAPEAGASASEPDSSPSANQSTASDSSADEPASDPAVPAPEANAATAAPFAVAHGTAAHHGPDRYPSPLEDLTPLAYLQSLIAPVPARAQESATTTFASAPQDTIVVTDEGTSTATRETVSDSPTESVQTPVTDTSAGDVRPGGSEYTAADDDVRVCTVLGTPCHTLTLSGFDIGSVLSDHIVKGYELRLSLGAKVIGESVTYDKLIVRYYHRGAWQLAGEVQLDRSLSNFDNGGHFSFPLPDLVSWDALKDFSVELEYVRQGTARTELFVDSAWVDATYEVESADEPVPEARNILPELALLEESGRPDLLLADGKRIELSQSDAAPGDDLVIRSDKTVYNGLVGGRAYVAVTNASDREESFALTVRTAKQADIVAVYERTKNAPIESDTPSYNDVAYFCENGWEVTDTVDTLVPLASPAGDTVSSDSAPQPVDGAAVATDTPEGGEAPLDAPAERESSLVQTFETTVPESDAAEAVESDVQDTRASTEQAVTLSDTYVCKATHEQETCHSFNADKTNCIKGNERVGVDAATVYRDAWRDVPLSEASDTAKGGFFSWLGLGGGKASSSADRLPNGRTSAERFALMPHQTIFFAIDLAYPVQRAGEFTVDVAGEETQASRSMWWRSAYGFRIPVTVATLAPEGGATSTPDVPLLSEVTIDRTHPEFFEHAALDGRDVRFYDASLRLELPAKELSFSYVDQTARYAVELGEGRESASTSIYAYFGNEFVDAGDRLAAPSVTDAPIEYVGVAAPHDGATLAITSERDQNAYTVGGGEARPLSLAETTNVLLPDRDTRLAARGPVRVHLADEEWAAGRRTVLLDAVPFMHVSETKLSDGRSDYLLERYDVRPATVAFGVMEELPLPAVGVFEPQAFKTIGERLNYLRDLRGPAYHDFSEALKDFEIGDDVVFKLQYRPQKNAISRFFRGLFRQRLATVGDVWMMRGGERVDDARFEVAYGAEGAWTIRMTEAPREMAPGKYTIELTVDEAGTTYTDSFDFYWGVLVVNTPKSIYEADDPAEFHMAALDDKGDTICDAELRLTITTPDGNTEELPVELQPTCGPNNVTDEPDYLAHYRPRTIGTYGLMLTQVNMNGDIVHQVTDSFEVRESQPYGIERRGATRIWPKAEYTMQIAVTAHDDGPADIIEAVPENFRITDTGGAETTVWGGAKRIVWHADLRAGETQIFSYVYDAPNVSPYLYLLGPAEVRAGDGLPFRETRSWKLASDALGEYVESAGTFTLGATGWNTVSLASSPYSVPADAIVEIFVAATVNNRDVIAGVRQQGSTLARYLNIDQTSNTGGQTGYTTFVKTTSTSSIEAYTNNTARAQFQVLGYWTSGTYVETFNQIDPGIADNTWGNYNLSSYGVSDGKTVEFVLANFAGTDYNAGVRTAGSSIDRRVQIHAVSRAGANYATMLVRASTSNATIQMNAQVEGANNASIDYFMMGYWSANPTDLEYQERYDDLGGPSSATTWTDKALDGYGTYKNNIAEVLLGYSSDTAGKNSLGGREKGSSQSRTLPLAYADGAGTGWNTGRMHVPTDATASSTIQYYSESTTADNFRLLGYWKAFNLAPETMTFYDTPFDNEKTGSSTPYFDFSTTDPDGSSDLQYEIQWDDDADLDTAPLGDEVSTSTNSYFVNTASSTDTSPFLEGNRIRFTMQSALTTGVTYYWRVRAKDVSGSNTFGDWSSVQSVTYVENTSPKAWYQTGDAQFDKDTRSGTETYGSERVRLATTPPTGAMVAYGDGTVPTPRYRLWDGSAWGSQLSALEVTGTVNWTILRAGSTRNEYVLGTQTATGTIIVQVYNAASSTWGNKFTLTRSAPSADRRSFDIAYKSVAGDAVVAYCDGDADPSYAVWNGSAWSATSTIDLQFNANCNWISMAGSRTTDDIIMVAQADSTNTTSDFEAQVYANSAWGNSWTGGANTAGEEYYERMDVMWEDSGTEAVVVVGNGGTANFISATWNSVNLSWTLNANRTTQDDFEWGRLTADDGSDNLGLCYIDEDNQVHIAKWTGSSNTWDTYDAAGDQIEATGLGNGATDYHGRGVTCEYEVTSGRDGYLMVPYSDATNARYRVWNGTSLTTEASVSTIEDSWFVTSARTGDGKILTLWRDNTNARYDFSYWNASTWSARETLGSSMSDTSEPYGESMTLAAQRFQSASGYIVSPIVDFDLVPGKSTWGEVLWSTTQTTGQDVKLQVLYATTTSVCNTLVPDSALSGNAAGFDVSASPLNLSGLSTSTYNMICIKAALTSSVASSPTLDDWTVSWQRRPYLSESRYRWYVNDPASLTPSDVWPSGGDAVEENTPIPAAFAPNLGAILRLRLAIKDTNVSLSASTTAFKLQWAEGSVCSASMSWADVGAAGSAVAWRGYDNGSLSDGATVPSTLLSTSDVAESYEESNPSVGNPNSIAVNDEGEWDFVLQHNATSSTNYCFRVMMTDGTLLNAYDVYPQLVTNAPPTVPQLVRPFDNEAVASTSPWFDFVAEDVKNDDLHYEIQVDDDIAFGSPLLDRNSEDNYTEFTNTVTTADKSPYNAGEQVRFVPATPLADGTTYWWRVRARDPNGSGDWSAWSDAQSVTASSTVLATTWHQTTYDQFSFDTLEQAEATGTNAIVLTPPATVGTATSPSIDYDWGMLGNAWGSLSWSKAGTSTYRIEYNNSGVWTRIPDSALPGNAAGFTSSPVSLLGLDPTTYNEIRIVAVLTNTGVAPSLYDWTVSWGYAVSQPTLVALFDNEKTGTTTPTFRFYSTDPQGDKLQYQIQWSTTTDFSASTTRTSGTDAGFANTASSTETSPFTQSNTVRFTVQSGDALTNSTTYWWRVRARDPGGANVWSVWSSLRSFTVDTSVTVSTWFQTTDAQFSTDALSNTEVYGANSVRTATVVREGLIVYAEGVVQTPRYRLWNGSSWGSEKSASNIGERMYWARTAAAPTRDEYALVTGGISGLVKAQIYTGVTQTWGTAVDMSVPASALRRGFDVAYETNSGDALAASCYGVDATYRVWNGSSWSASSTINLSFTQNCEWIKMASDPTSDEIILVARANPAQTPYAFEMQVWNGSAWGNATTAGLMEAADAENVGMDVEYEESGGDAVVVVSNGTNANFHYRTWNGSVWSSTSSVATADDLEVPKIRRDVGTDDMVMCFVAQNLGLYYTRWTGSSWAAPTNYSIDANSKDGSDSFDCSYETSGSRDGYIMFPYTDATNAFYRYWDKATLQPEAALSTITDSWSVQSVRTGDGRILTGFWDDANTNIDVSDWNGAAWTAQTTLETNVSALATNNVPMSLSARRYPTVTSGTVVSTPINFYDGSGPRWDYLSWNDTTSGGSDIKYQVEYSSDSGSSWSLVPDAVLPGNSVGSSTGPVLLQDLPYTTYNLIRVVGNFTCNAGTCPTLADWTVAWSAGITVSGTAQQYDESTNVTSGTVAVAVNGVLQSGKTGSISGGTWSIPNVTVFPGDTLAVFIDGAADASEAAAVTKYDGIGNITGIKLFERHLSLGSDDATTTTNALLALYDYSSSGDEDVFFDVDSGNDLYVCAAGSGACGDAKLYVRTGNTYRPDSANSGTLYVHDVVNYGTTTADSNTFYVSGSWYSAGLFAGGGSTVIFTATSGVETVVNDASATSSFYNITFGQASGSAVWTQGGTIDADNNLTLSYGTLSAATSSLLVGGNYTIGSSASFLKGSGTTTLDGTTIATITDGTAAKQDLGKVLVSGASKTVRLGSAAKLTDLTVESGATFDVSANNYALEIIGSLNSSGSFSARAGTVTFTATTTGKVINPGSSSFWNLTTSGTGGNWAFSQPAVVIGNNLTVASGTLTLSVGTTTVSGNITNTGGTFVHNNGTVELSGTGAKTLYQNGSPFFNLTVNGAGSWSWTDLSATSSGSVRVQNGTLTFPSDTLAIGKSLVNSGGTLGANGGTLRFTSTVAETVLAGGSMLYGITFDGAGGTWALADTNLTASGTVRFLQGTTTLPSGTFNIGGSFLTTGGTWNANGGTVLFTSTATGRSVTPGQNNFNTVTFNSATGGWTVTASATSTGAWNLAAASAFTLASGATMEVRGTFTNSVPSATTWTGSTLYLNSATAYTIGSSTQAAESYGTLRIGNDTDIRIWQSSSTAYTVATSGSLYSMDHNGTDGVLYVWGDYNRTSGTDYWDYATDFDGTALGGSTRAVSVRLASGASARYVGATLEMTGGAGATTTVANQGSGTYTLSVTGGTVRAQYFALANMDASGLSILGSSTVSTFSDGAFTLSTTGGTMLTVSSTTIDANPAFQPLRMDFSTSSGVTGGYNVTATGTPASYWWFRYSTGNYDGENYDNDPVAGPGAIRWDDSGYTISISGTVYAGEGGGGPSSACDGVTARVRLLVNGTTPYAVSCNASTGAFTFPAVTFTGDVPLIAYLDGAPGARAATVTRTPTVNITNFDLYQNRVIVRHEDAAALTIAQMTPYDSDQDADIPFDAETGTLLVAPETALYVWSAKTFAPGGSVSLLSGGSGATYDGSLRLAATSTLTASGTESYVIGGSWVADSGSTFTPATSVVTFSATTSGKTITALSPMNDVIFNGSGGAWTIASALTVNGTATATAGTVSGTANITVKNGSFAGNGTVAMTGGTVTLEKGGAFGGTNGWTFYNLTLGDGTSGATAKSGTGGITVTNALSVLANHTLQAGGATWTFTGTGSVLAVSGTWSAQTSTTTFASTNALTVPALTYNNLVMAPSGGGSPTYTLQAGALNATTITVGNGTNGVTVNANANDPLTTVTGNVLIRSGASFSASNANDLIIGGSYTNQGTFTANGGGVVFNSSDTGETVAQGGSPFHHVTFNSAGGGWTVTGNATTTGNCTLTSAAAFTLQSGTQLTVQGAFLNMVGGAATTWTNTTLYLNSGTAYTASTKTAGTETYGTLRIGANTDVKFWNSTSTVYAIDASGSLYSMDHNGADGALYIWGDVAIASGNEYWSYATDFDGTDLATTSSLRAVAVYLAANATTTLSGGSLAIVGAAGATTTVQNQGSGTYALRVSGGTFAGQYYRIRNIDASGLAFTGSPTITSLSDGDFALSANGATMMSVAGSVIDANPLKNWQRIAFGTTTGISTGYNVTSSGSSASSWRFIPGSGVRYGEAYDNDSAPIEDPGYLIWSDSAASVSISGNVYSDEGSTVSTVCNGSTPVVRLMVQGTSTQITSCAAGTGAYTFSGINYNPGDTITVYLDGTSARAADVTVDLVSSINNMHLYENRVIVRHEDTSPISIAQMAVYDSTKDSDIPFTAATGTPNTLTLRQNTKLIVWTGKTFKPNGNITLNSGSGTAWDGTMDMQANASLVSSTTAAEAYAVGGSWLTGTGATFTAGLSSVTFTATTTGKLISPDTSPFYQLTFNGSGGAWTFADRDATTTDNFTISAGSVTLGTSTLAVGGSFTNSATMSAASTSIRFTSASPETVAFGGSSVGSLVFSGAGSHTMTDVNATSTGSVSIAAGSVVLPAGTFAVANNFTAAGGTFSHAGTLRLYGTLAAQSVTLSGSSLGSLTVAGAGSWSITDVNATTTGTARILSGGLTAPLGTFAVGGSFLNQATYNANAGLLYFYSTSTGNTITAGTSTLSSVTVQGAGGGWTLTGNATTSNAFRLLAGSLITVATGTRLEVQGTFQNLMGGTTTDWTNSTLYLNASGTSYTINTKSAGGDAYANLLVGANTDVRMWNSSGATTTVATTGSLYSMDHTGTDGSLYVYGEYVLASGADYWSYATDFDGTALGGSSRAVSVRVASSSSLSFTGGSLAVVGAAGATTSIDVIGSGTYAWSVSGGTINAQYYSVRNLTAAGLVITGSPTITSLSYGDWELAVSGGTLINVASSTIDQNPTKAIVGTRFATGTGVTAGWNVTRTGTTTNFWDFQAHTGSFSGESYDNDGADACGSVRWDNSVCLEVSQTHYQFRNDDGGGGAPNSEWYDADWTKRKRVNVTNPNASALTNAAVSFDLAYDSDMQADFSDIRFTDSSGTTTLPYFIERYTSSATATIWVKVPSIPASGSTHIFAYYGNAYATNGENGSSTFTFFDDFEDNNIAEYSGDTSYFSVQAAFNKEGSYGLGAASGYTNSQTPDGIYRTGTTFGRDTTISWYQKMDSTKDDEPCTLFGVQSPGSNNQNYAVCLDQYPTDKLVLAKNISSNDSSGTTLASSTKTWTTQWYQVRVDWLSTNTINVSVYDASGALFATTSASDSTYTSGGMGFSFWYQNEGWDLYTVRPYAASMPTAWVGPEQGKDGASFKVNEDTSMSQEQGQTFRVRFGIENTGPQITGQQWRLQAAEKTGYGTCNAVPDVEYSDVPNATGCGTSAICMTTSSHFADGDGTQQLLYSPSYLSFAEGKLVESPSNQTSGMTLNQGYMTEVEYALQVTPYATADSYCMRVTNGGVELDSYQQVAEVTAKYGPSISDWSLNNDGDIALVEGQTTMIYATGTVSDLNGYEDILYATTTIYRSGVGVSCADNPNNCYQLTSLQCPLENCTGTTCTINCGIPMYYFADPTDPLSTYEAQHWEAVAYVIDTTNNEATSTSVGVDVLTMRGLTLTTGPISYGSLELGQDTQAYNATSTLQNTGNVPIDVQLEGTDMTNGSSSIPVGNEKFATSSFTYSGCVICTALSGTASTYEVDLGKPTSTSTPITDDLYWGVYVPTGVAGVTHTGRNTFYAVGD